MTDFDHKLRTLGFCLSYRRVLGRTDRQVSRDGKKEAGEESSDGGTGTMKRNEALGLVGEWKWDSTPRALSAR
jgi:hypothetical protein